MLRDDLGRPLTDGFTVHGTDVETVWEPEVPTLTPNARFFVRSHTRPPEVDEAAWRLRLTGDGLDRPAELSLDDLRALGPVTRQLALECTGNGRAFFGEQQGTPRPGTPWRTGAIGNARWTGVPLAQVLELAGLREDAVSVMAVGLDEPYVEDGVDHGPVRRPLPVGKALDDVLVCWGMNGEPLPPDHGHPVRLVVPGWVGIASIKWLGELRVTRRAEDSPWTTRWYRMHGPGWEGEDAVLGRMPVKSLVDTRGPFRAGEQVRLRGRAWSGEAAITSVTLSTDGGVTWQQTRLVGDNLPSSWTHWEADVVLDSPGEHCLVTRAVDTTGRTQPDLAPDNEQGYLYCAPLRQPVTVTG